MHCLVADVIAGVSLVFLLMSFAATAAEKKGASPSAQPPDAVQTNPLQADWAKRLKCDVEIKNSLGMRLMLIPPGEFQMGAPPSDREAMPGEKPRHRVRITKPFYLGKFEVTQREWISVMNTEPWKGKLSEPGEDAPSTFYPATFITWLEATEFCLKLSKKEGGSYRLPTEAEWEYACRVNTLTQFPTGDDEATLDEYAWNLKNSPNAKLHYAHRVGRKKANGFGLHDMVGNVWELCSDWQDDKYYASSPLDDPQGPSSGIYRVMRGGAWNSGAWNARSSFRGGSDPKARRNSMGFRVVRVPPPKP